MFYSSRLKKIKNVKHCFFSRNSGFSKGIYNSLNCGFGSKDNKSNIKKNLLKVSKFLNIKQNNLKLMHQTHSAKVIFINKKNLKKNNFRSDALLTDQSAVGLAVLTADCVPIIIIDKKNKIIGCIHAGWKGALKGVVENTIKILNKKNKHTNIIAGVGPCIGRNSYEVSKYFKKKFDKIKNYRQFFKSKNNKKDLFNLRKFVNYKLKISGVKKIDNINLDTFKNTNLFFSYRKSVLNKENDYGRCISTIVLENKLI